VPRRPPTGLTEDVPAPPREEDELIRRILRFGVEAKPRNYYLVFDIAATAAEGELKKAFRKACIKVHPDKSSHPQATSAFQCINEGFAALSDPSKRAVHDSHIALANATARRPVHVPPTAQPPPYPAQASQYAPPPPRSQPQPPRSQPQPPPPPQQQHAEPGSQHRLQQMCSGCTNAVLKQINVALQLGQSGNKEMLVQRVCRGLERYQQRFREHVLRKLHAEVVGSSVLPEWQASFAEAQHQVDEDRRAKAQAAREEMARRAAAAREEMARQAAAAREEFEKQAAAARENMARRAAAAREMQAAAIKAAQQAAREQAARAAAQQEAARAAAARFAAQQQAAAARMYEQRRAAEQAARDQAARARTAQMAAAQRAAAEQAAAAKQAAEARAAAEAEQAVAAQRVASLRREHAAHGAERAAEAESESGRKRQKVSANVRWTASEEAQLSSIVRALGIESQGGKLTAQQWEEAAKRMRTAPARSASSTFQHYRAMQARETLEMQEAVRRATAGICAAGGPATPGASAAPPPSSCPNPPAQRTDVGSKDPPPQRPAPPRHQTAREGSKKRQRAFGNTADGDTLKQKGISEFFRSPRAGAAAPGGTPPSGRERTDAAQAPTSSSAAASGGPGPAAPQPSVQAQHVVELD
jgi:curved DNA-binding protein CbpA